MGQPYQCLKRSQSMTKYIFIFLLTLSENVFSMQPPAPLMLVRVPIIHDITRQPFGYAYIPWESDWTRSIYVVEDDVDDVDEAIAVEVDEIVAANAVND